QLRKQNSYSKALKQLLYAPYVTPESVAGRRALAEIGADLTRFVRWLLGKKNLQITIIPLGSSLKAYAAPVTDIEFTVGLLNGPDYIPDEENERILDKAMKLLQQRRHDPEGQMRDITEVAMFSPATQDRLGDVLPNRDEDLLFELQENHEWASLFLPVAYTSD